ncbi:hypothetical protein GCM10020295_11700 [Streptomyces cinereospinus]
MERGRKAEAVAPALELREAADAEHRAAVAAEARARAALPEGFAGAGPAGLAAAARRTTEEFGGLESARRAERRLADVRAERAGLDRQERADEDVLHDAETWLAGWEPARAGLQERIDAAQEAASRAEQLAVRREPVQQRLGAARKRDQLAGDTEAAQRQALASGERALQARTHWLDLKEQRLNGIAAELATGLADGEPCAVCGATEHPAPARKVAGHVDREAEERALAASRRAEEAHADDERRLNLVRQALAAAAAEAGDTPTGRLVDEAEELERQYARARREASGLHAAREELRRAEQEHERRTTARREAELRAASRQARREALDRERTTLEGELAQARGSSGSVAARAAELENRAARLTEAAEAARHAEDTAQRLKDADARLADAAFRAGFDTPQAAAAALLDAATHRELQRRLDARQAEEAAVRAVLAEADTAAAAQRPAADLAAAEQAAAAAGRAGARRRLRVRRRHPSPRRTGPAVRPGRRRGYAGSRRCARSTTGWPGWPGSRPAPPPRTNAGCGWSRTSSRRAWSRWPPPRPRGCSGCRPAATPSSTPTTGPGAGAAASGCTSSTPGPGGSGTPRRCRAARRSSPRWRSPSAWRTSSRTRRAGCGWTPSSSTRASAASTTRPSTRCWTCWTHCASGTGASAS